MIGKADAAGERVLPWMRAEAFDKLEFVFRLNTFVLRGVKTTATET